VILDHGDDLPVMPGSAIGIIPNPMSGRDIRRIVSQASVFPNTEKASMVLRILRAAGTLGLERVLLSTDTFGIAAGVQREITRLSNARSTAHVRWPKVDFLELDQPTGTAADTTAYARIMAGRCSAAVVLLGGDGTMRAAVPGLGDTPMLALSTGTNNAFPVMLEATVAGMAVGMIAIGAATVPDTRCKLLHVEVARRDGGVEHEVALVDACVSTTVDVGSRALWTGTSLRELYCTFGEPHGIGLSSIVGRLMPTHRRDTHGAAVMLDDPARAAHTVLAPLAPGLLQPVGVTAVGELQPDRPRTIGESRGTVAVDGERELEFGPDDTVTVTLRHDGPRVIDVPAALGASTHTQALLTR
jgi:predicted polyphosphate/ATP-dependent NAD kinase